MIDVHIVGVGIHPFGRHPGLTGLEQGVHATHLALQDADLSWPEIQFAFGGSVAAGNADAALSSLGPSGIPFINVVNGCATGGSALLAGYMAIRSEQCDLGLVLGFDKHPAGAFNFLPEDNGLPSWYGEIGLMLTTQFFGVKIRRYMDLHGISDATLARVAEKAFHNGSLTPHAWRRQPMGIDEILSAPMVSDPLTKYMFCSPSEGAVALIVASARKMRELGLRGPRVRAVTTRTRTEGTLEVFAPSFDVTPGRAPTQLASAAAFDMAGLGPEDIDLAQVQDTDSGAEIIHLAESGFCRDGEQEKLMAERATWLGGALPVNTDGGCLASGEPIGASGLRQVYENVVQLRGTAEKRQVAGARIAYSQVYGMPGVSAVSILEGS